MGLTAHEIPAGAPPIRVEMAGTMASASDSSARKQAAL